MTKAFALAVTIACAAMISPAEARPHKPGVHKAKVYKAARAPRAGHRRAVRHKAGRHWRSRPSAQAPTAAGCSEWQSERFGCGGVSSHSIAAHPPRRRSGLVTIDTAAGISITVSASAAPAFQGFIADLVDQGYRPQKIHCYARGGHVRNSNHYWGGACDFDQRGWNKTARPMYRVRELAAKWGLRDGCTFRDCGHVDVPRYAAR